MRRSFVVVAMGAAAALLLAAGGPAAAHAAAARAAIPASFHAQSVTFPSPDHGWMLGTAPCGQDTCTTVATSTDAGATWASVGTIAAPLTMEKSTGVTEIRFADDLHGWAFDPALWSTADGGATWTKVTPPGQRPVVALAADADAAYAVVSACHYGEAIGDCTDSMTLWRTTPGQPGWAQESVTLPVMNQAVLAVHGLAAYVAVPAALLDEDRTGAPMDGFAVTLDGQTWSSRPDPCDPTQGETLTSIAAVSDTRVDLLCQGNIGFGKAAKHVLRSDDAGQTTTPGGSMGIYGIETQLAAAPNGTAVAASYSIGTWIYRNGPGDGQHWTTQLDLGDGGMGWNDVLFTSNEVGWVIHGPAAICCLGHSGQLWKTTDGGLTWGPA
jgi:hypothetical protein